MTSAKDDLDLVVGLACLTEDRSDREQHALLRVAARLDNQLNAQVVTNRRVGPASRLLETVEKTRVLVPEYKQRPVALSAGARASWADRVERWDADLFGNAAESHCEDVDIAAELL